MQVLQKKIIFVGGKGGVGKSTSAAAIAWKSAKNGNSTLLISTDPAHNLGDIFAKSIGGSITRISTNLDALEIDPAIETEHYIKGVKDNIKNVVHSSMMEEVHRQLDTAKSSPGADEAALFDKLISIILEENDHYDKLIFDTAPTGHTIRLLSLPELMGVWIKGMLKKRKKTNDNYTQLLNDGDPVEDPIYDVLKERQERFSTAREILLDGNLTGFVFVINPERLPITETEKAIKLLDQYHLHVKTLIINKILPEHADGKFLIERKEHERQYIDLINRTFTKQEKIYVPLFPHDIISTEHLETFSYYYREEQKHESFRT
ncbi:arsenite efflux ATP-binding protein ArsA (TC 3.A.4.1.1) [Lentibacillus halodurans]|uniref:Arsenite efflux ATP-binding protein ArsA (TC 3.A.4.1.1) n=1 Tax=Lentibacillus halodurans TaxID=237679 RepID=A0A1I1AAZ3_9BACI|nr:ArsA family ATPase [Lentibacillus halodurans]SFB35124.1 arsenite efflux ATP-binding protein ArsA (TC 3.A.4.1.1) [Lentibacillus halodurans]